MENSLQKRKRSYLILLEVLLTKENFSDMFISTKKPHTLGLKRKKKQHSVKNVA